MFLIYIDGKGEGESNPQGNRNTTLICKTETKIPISILLGMAIFCQKFIKNDVAI